MICANTVEAVWAAFLHFWAGLRFELVVNPMSRSLLPVSSVELLAL